MKAFCRHLVILTLLIGPCLRAQVRDTLDEKVFPVSWRKGIRQSAEAMQVRKLPPNPYEGLFKEVVEQMRQSGSSEEIFFGWNQVFLGILGLPDLYTPFRINEFLSLSKAIFASQPGSRIAGGSWSFVGSAPTWHWENQEPRLYFKKVTWSTGYKSDSLRIRETSGSLFPLRNHWQGIGGQCDWARVGLDNQVYVQLRQYTLSLKGNRFTADSAIFFYPRFFGKTGISGSFQDQIVSQPDSSLISYPRFYSFRKDLTITQFGEGIKYVGGFSLEGRSVGGFGTVASPARITLVNNKAKVVFVGASEKFSLRRADLISSQKVNATLFLGADSINHPELQFQYMPSSRTLLLKRGETGKGRNLFHSSAHQFSFQSEELVMQIDRDSVMIGREALPIVRKPIVRFESQNFFNENEYEAQRGIATRHPLQRLYQLCREKKTMVFDATQLAGWLDPKFTVESIRSLLYEWIAAGYVDFREESNRVTVLDKVLTTVEAATGIRDFDRLRIDSRTDSVNAWLTLSDKAILIQAVKSLEFSPARRVRLLPLRNEVRLLPGRTLLFSGILKAGFTELTGTRFTYDYPRNTVRMDSIASFRIFLPESSTDSSSFPKALSLTSEIESFAGVLGIDAPENKSGKENIPSFPILNSRTGGFIYYDGFFARDTSLKRDSFYFALAPFIFPGMDQIREDQVRFKGNLFSGSIFPVFGETVRVRPFDYSLGFLHSTPKEGYVAYRGKGTYAGDLDLSNRGLRGKGKLNYLGAVINAEDFVFRPDKVTASARAFSLQEEIRPLPIPKVAGRDVSVTWRPFQDSLYLTSGTYPFRLFRPGVHVFHGNLIVTPDGVGGSGTLDWPEAILQAGSMQFGAQVARSDSAWLRIKGRSEGEVLLEALNVKGSMDFENSFGRFDGNNPSLLTELPFNGFTTSLTDFDWNAQEKMVYFRSDTNTAGIFRSRVPGQDSLRFMGKNARYNLRDFGLEIGGVDYIHAADARIIPHEGRISIRANGLFDTLDRAIIFCDTINLNHKITDATVSIQGRKAYAASGFYEYNLPGKLQRIRFSSIIGQRVGKGLMSQKATATRAQGEIDPDDDFRIDTKTTFFGRIGLSSEEVSLSFDGYARLESHALEEKSWFRLNTKGDKKNLILLANRPKNPEGLFLETGLFLSAEKASIYPRFLQPLPFRKDRAVFQAQGFIRYDRLKDQFHFGDSTCVSGGSCAANLMVLDEKSANLTGEGDFNLASGLKAAEVKASGVLRTKLPKTQELSDTGEVEQMVLDIDLMLGLNLRIPARFLNIMENELASASFGAQPIPYLSDLDFYRRMFPRVLGDTEETRDLLGQLSSGFFELPARSNPFSFLFGGIKMKWDSEFQAFINANTQVGLISLGGKSVSMKINAFIEMRMPGNLDDRIYLYLKMPNDIYYYFGLRKGFLEMNSNDTRFQDELLKTKKADLLLKLPTGEVVEIQPVEANRAQMFVRRAMSAGK